MNGERRPLAIAMVSEHASPLARLGDVDAGGQNVAVARLSAAMAAHGHRVVVYTRRDDERLPDRVQAEEGYTVVHVPAGPPARIPKDSLLRYMPEFGDFLCRSWGNERPDVVHAHFWMSGLAALRGARPHAVPVLQTFHALGAVKRLHQGTRDTSPGERIRMEARLAHQADWVLATCSDEVRELEAMGRRSRLSVVPCGVDVDKFRDVGPIAVRGNRKRIVSVGRLVPRKGFDTIIRAMPHIDATELVIVGGPDKAELDADPEAIRLQRLAQRVGVADRVHLYGGIEPDEMPMLLRSADVVAVTPWYEPFGIVPVEAMACGVPVIASAVGGMLDTVIDDVTGRLVPPKDPRAFAQAVQPLLWDRSLRNRLGNAGRARACAQFTWESCSLATEEAYRRLVA